MELGYLGYPLALALAAPCYAVLQRAFVRAFGPLPLRRALTTVALSWAITAAAYRLGGGALSLAVFLAGHAALFAWQPELRSAVRDGARMLLRG
jgi:hypothetical protein